jgi:hypothetical protein
VCSSNEGGTHSVGQHERLDVLDGYVRTGDSQQVGDSLLEIDTVYIRRQGGRDSKSTL